MVTSNPGQGMSLTRTASSQVGEPSDANIGDNADLPRNTTISILAVFFAIVATVVVFSIFLHRHIHRRAKQQLIVEL